MCECQTWHYASQYAYLNIQSINLSPQTVFCMWRLMFWESQLFIFQYRWPVSSEHLELKLSQKNSAHHIFMGCTFSLTWQKNLSNFFSCVCSGFYCQYLKAISFLSMEKYFMGGNGNVFESQMFMEIACFYNIHTAFLLLFLKLLWDFHTLIQLHFIVFWNQH